VCPNRSSGYFAEYLLAQVWVSPYRFIDSKKTLGINHTKQSNGWFLSCAFAIPLRFILWQKRNLKTTVYRNVKFRKCMP